MKLTEHEAKTLLKNYDVALSFGEQFSVADFNTSDASIELPAFCKAQVLHGNRGEQGLVQRVASASELETLISDWRENQPDVTQFTLEPAITFTESVYLSLGYDTRTRGVIIRYSQEGGVGMDERGSSISTTSISAIDEPTSFPPNPELVSTIKALWQAFKDLDATLLEINPLVKTADGWTALDAKVELEDVAHSRHPEWETYGERSDMGRPPTEREKQAHEVSHSDHRGVAGESFFEFPGGNIGVMASGGGASTLAMDALLAAGLQPANYTEYSGNPTREKVEKLAEVVLSIPNLDALYVAGSNANFTDIFETLAGVIDGFLASDYSKKEGFIILIRRGGPRWQEAFEMVQERLANLPVTLKLCGPEYSLVQTAQDLAQLLTEKKS